MKPAWLESWLGSPLERLDEERLTTALEAARLIVERLSQEQLKPRNGRAQVEINGLLAEWQAAISELLRARADRAPSETPRP